MVIVIKLNQVVAMEGPVQSVAHHAVLGPELPAAAAAAAAAAAKCE